MCPTPELTQGLSLGPGPGGGRLNVSHPRVDPGSLAGSGQGGRNKYVTPPSWPRVSGWAPPVPGAAPHCAPGKTRNYVRAHGQILTPAQLCPSQHRQKHFPKAIARKAPRGGLSRGYFFLNQWILSVPRFPQALPPGAPPPLEKTHFMFVPTVRFCCRRSYGLLSTRTNTSSRPLHEKVPGRASVVDTFS